MAETTAQRDQRKETEALQDAAAAIRRLPDLAGNVRQDERTLHESQRVLALAVERAKKLCTDEQIAIMTGRPTV